MMEMRRISVKPMKMSKEEEINVLSMTCRKNNPLLE